MGLQTWGRLTVQANCLSGYSHYPPPQPPAQLSPDVQHIIQQALNADIHANKYREILWLRVKGLCSQEQLKALYQVVLVYTELSQLCSS